jgi:hypothetical protein
MAGEISLPFAYVLFIPFWLGTSIYSVMFATTASGIVPDVLLKKQGYELALTCLGMPAALMAIQILTVGMTRILTGTGDPTKGRTNNFLVASNMCIKNHFE